MRFVRPDVRIFRFLRDGLIRMGETRTTTTLVGRNNSSKTYVAEALLLLNESGGAGVSIFEPGK